MFIGEHVTDPVTCPPRVTGQLPDIGKFLPPAEARATMSLIGPRGRERLVTPRAQSARKKRAHAFCGAIGLEVRAEHGCQ